MPKGSRVLTVEFKVNFLSPAQGEHFRAEGRVVKSGKTISVCDGKMFAIENGQEKLVAIMQATMICVRAANERGERQHRGKNKTYVLKLVNETYTPCPPTF